MNHSQKKVIRRFQRYLNYGEIPGGAGKKEEAKEEAKEEMKEEEVKIESKEELGSANDLEKTNLINRIKSLI